MIRRFRDWFCSLSTARRNAVLGGGLAMLFAIALLSTGETPASPPAARPAVPPATSPSPAGVTVPVMPGTTPRRDTVTPQYAWAAAGSFLGQSQQDGNAAITESMKPFFEAYAECKKGIPAFTDDVLGGWGKLAVAGDMFASLANGVASIFTDDTVMTENQMPAYIRQSFTTRVVNDDRLSQLVRTTVQSYVAHLGELDSRLLVSLQADIPDLTFDASELPDMSAEIANAMPKDWHFRNTVGMAAVDLFVGTGKQAASFIGGELISNAVMGNTPFIARVPGDLAVGRVVDKALDGGLSAVGYEPEKQIADLGEQLLISAFRQTVSGDPDTIQALIYFLDMAEGHPDDQVRAACQTAAEVIEREAPIGLTTRLYLLNVRRVRRRVVTIYRHIFGPDAEVPASFLHAVVNPSAAPSPDKIIAAANQWTAYYKGHAQ